MRKILVALYILVMGFSADLSAYRVNPNIKPDPIEEVAKVATPAAVFITAEVQPQGFGYSTQEDPYEMFNDELFHRFFGGRPNRQPRRGMPAQVSQGSGFLVSADGYIMTNYHVVRNGKNIKVFLHNSIKHRELSAELIGGDPQTDVAVLKISHPNNEDFPYLRFANSNDVKVGQQAIAIGSPFQLEATVTSGIISAKGRQDLQISDLEDFIQTDAAINPGNSGGPLLNIHAEVVGINTAIVAPNGGYVGIGFAVPSNIANSIRDQLVSNGKVSRGFLGVHLQPIDSDLAEAFKLPNNDGALVAEVLEGSPAEAGGLKQGDVIVMVNGQPVRTPSSLRREIMLNKPGTKLRMKIIRNGKPQTLTVTVGSHEDVHGSGVTVSGELGLTVDNLTPDNIARYHLSEGDTGVVITDVNKNSIAGRMGIRPGFLIMAVNHQKVTNVKEFNQALSDRERGKPVLLLIRSGDTVRFFTFPLK